MLPGLGRLTSRPFQVGQCWPGQAQTGSYPWCKAPHSSPKPQACPPPESMWSQGLKVPRRSQEMPKGPKPSSEILIGPKRSQETPRGHACSQATAIPACHRTFLCFRHGGLFRLFENSDVPALHSPLQGYTQCHRRSPNVAVKCHSRMELRPPTARKSHPTSSPM